MTGRWSSGVRGLDAGVPWEIKDAADPVSRTCSAVCSLRGVLQCPAVRLIRLGALLCNLLRAAVQREEHYSWFQPKQMKLDVTLKLEIIRILDVFSDIK